MAELFIELFSEEIPATLQIDARKKIKQMLVEIHNSALKLDGIENPEEAVEQKLQLLGFNNIQYLDDSHILASKS